VLTGHGLKDPATAQAQAAPVIDAAADPEAVMEALGW
jgi:hypothetical protein